jgi:hypothetical protein
LGLLESKYNIIERINGGGGGGGVYSPLQRPKSRLQALVYYKGLGDTIKATLYTAREIVEDLKSIGYMKTLLGLRSRPGSVDATL